MQITDSNRPLCKKCEKPAITYLNQMWLCGNCLIELTKKVDELKQKLIMEE